MNLDLTSRYYGNELGVWIVAAAVGVAVFIGLYVVRRTIGRRLHRVDVNIRNDWAEAVYVCVIRGGTWLPIILVCAVYAAIYFLDLPAALKTLVDRVIVIALLLQVALWGTRFIGVGISDYTRRRRAIDPSSASGIHIVSVIARAALWAVVTLVVLDNLGIDITALVAGLGIGGIAIALAAQNILGDLFSSLTIILDKPFKAGDFVIFGAEAGTIERIGIKTTRVRSLTGEEIVVSNSDLLSARIRNFRRMNERLGQFVLGVEYGTSVEKLEVFRPLFARSSTNTPPPGLIGFTSTSTEIFHWILKRCITSIVVNIRSLWKPFRTLISAFTARLRTPVSSLRSRPKPCMS